MTLNTFKCPICGEKTRFYYGNPRRDLLCPTHADMLKNGDIQIDENKNFIDTKTSKILNQTQFESEYNDTCIVCDSQSYGKLQCKDCYYETRDHMDNLDKNSKSWEFRDHYFNLKDSIMRIWNFEKVQSNCNRLIAIALLNEKINGDESLTDRIKKDVKYFIEKKKSNIESNEEEKEEKPKNTQQDQYAEEVIRTTDGHRVKSDPEKQIDDFLYRAKIIHSYNQAVIEIDERAVYCDWFIPVKSEINGIYIEYWGMSTQEYLKNKKEKIELYTKYNLPLIQIEKDDIKDSQGFMMRLVKELKRLSKEYYKTEFTTN